MIIRIKKQDPSAAFTQQKLNQKLQDANISARITAAECLYLLDTDKPPADEQRLFINNLLGQDDNIPIQNKHHPIIIMPRLGTISPWSSKATDIIHLCGLTAIKRIDIANIYYLECNHPTDKLTTIAAPLFDKMTQCAVFNETDTHALFQSLPPKTQP